MLNGKMSVLDLLDQDKIWVTREGQTLTLEEMEPSHRRNTLALLRRKAFSLNLLYFTRYFGGPGPNGDIAQSTFERATDEFIDQDPKKWLEEQPLVSRLAALVDADGARERRLALRLVRPDIPQHAGPVVRLGGLRRG